MELAKLAGLAELVNSAKLAKLTKTHFLGTSKHGPQLSATLPPSIFIARTENRTMKLLVLVATVALVTCESSSDYDYDTLSEMREEFAQMKAEMKDEMKTQISELKTENTEMKAKIARLEAHRNATTAGKLEFFVQPPPRRRRNWAQSTALARGEH